MNRAIRVAACVVALATSIAACTTTGSRAATASHAPAGTPHPQRSRAARTQPDPPGTRNGPPWESAPLTAGHLRHGSRPGVLPGDLLIADKLNERLIIIDPAGRIRWQFPRPGDLPPGTTFKVPDDAFFTPDGREIVTTEEDDFVIRVIDVATHKIVYRYGTPGVPGSGPNHLWNPDDAVMLPGGDILTADIKNHRLLLIRPGRSGIVGQWGRVGEGYHAPPTNYGAPNGVFPAGGGRFLVTEIRGSWVDGIDLHGHVFWSTHPPGVVYPSDTNRIGPDRYLTVDYSQHGQILVFTRSGRTIWRYAPQGRERLDHPSLALPLPNGDIVCNDDMNHRVIVVDPRTNRIVWQYGHTGVPGRAPGYLDNPDGLDLVPPYSLIDRTTAGRVHGSG